MYVSKDEWQSDSPESDNSQGDNAQSDDAQSQSDFNDYSASAGDAGDSDASGHGEELTQLLDMSTSGMYEKQQPARPQTLSVIGETLVFLGDLTAEEDLLIQGQVSGSIQHRAQNLTIGASGDVRADIVAQHVIIQGKVRGDVRASESIIVAASARVQGNLYAPVIGLKEGARFKGSIDMDPGAWEQPKKPAASAQPAAQSTSQSQSAAAQSQPQSSASPSSSQSSAAQSQSQSQSQSKQRSAASGSSSKKKSAERKAAKAQTDAEPSQSDSDNELSDAKVDDILD